ncbi:glycerophosphodiester phosphodiesterase family protein [Microbacterium sp. W4I4]|uniref:glycerophosphodiester phosphodiesterase family protein n=1 Tax=Microbacterium sp. W4I4 TaxID=3042295 RepID=UPI0027D79D80|nr:glycerophosphodiester phosphodiesterase family protein [Microbacterium sp. W4I4]
MTTVLALLAGAGVATGAAHAAPADDHRASLQQKGFGLAVMAVAHLGDWRNAPENSIPAIEQAADLGAEIVEIDIRRTSDGHLVVMHDNDLSRTTNGTGTVSARTLSYVEGLWLREYRGGAAAELTNHRVPTFTQALAAAGNDVLINVDKAWAHREQIWAEATAAGMNDQVLFKSNGTASEVNDFLNAHPDALYCHVIDATNYTIVSSFARDLDCYEVVWADAAEPHVSPAFLADLQTRGRVWMNSLWKNLAGTHTDEGALRDVGGWGELVAMGASIIQTDEPAALRYWAEGGRASTYGLPEGGVRVQAENYALGGAGIAYLDNDATNQGADVHRPDEGVDVCESENALYVCWIRGGEWISYTVTVPVTDTYRITARVSSPHRPAGRISLDFGTFTAPAIDIMTTTGHKYFLTQEIHPGVSLTAGTHTFTMHVPTGTNQNFNLDYWQFEPV